MGVVRNTSKSNSVHLCLNVSVTENVLFHTNRPNKCTILGVKKSRIHKNDDIHTSFFYRRLYENENGL